MKSPRPYVAVSGVASVADAKMLWRLLDKEILLSARRLVGAILVSRKTLRGETVESLRYPSIRDAQEIAATLAGSPIVPAVHYNSRTNGGDLLVELVELAQSVPAMRMLQLNVVCPPPEVIEEFRAQHPQVEIVLQLSQDARTQYEAAGLGAGDFLDHYARTLDHLLLDRSRGTGRAFPVEETAHEVYLLELRAHGLGVRLGVAGGLGPASRPTLEVLRGLGHDHTFAALSFDAESALRVPASHDFHVPGRDLLDEGKVRGYLQIFEGLP